MPGSKQGSSRSRLIRAFGILASCTALAAAAIVTMTAGAEADPNVPAPPLPVFTPTPTDWGPNFAFPHNIHQNQVTDADITAEREMCEWFNAQFDALMDQINGFNGNLSTNHDDYAAPGIQHQADAVTANIDQSEDYLAPRARSLTRREDCSRRRRLHDLLPHLRRQRLRTGLATAVQHQHQHQKPQPLGDQQHLHRTDQPVRQRHPRLRGVRLTPGSLPDNHEQSHSRPPVSTGHALLGPVAIGR